MRVVCDNCGASYRIPDHKLVKEVNKATCRKCGEAIIIRRSAGMSVGQDAKDVDPEANTQVTEMSAIGAEAERSEPQVASIPSGPSMGHGFGQIDHRLPEDAGPPTVAQRMDFKDETIPRQDLPERTAAQPPRRSPQLAPPPAFEPPPQLGNQAPPPSTPPAPEPAKGVPSPAPARQSSPPRPSPARSGARQGAHDSAGDLTVVMMSNFVCAAGALFIVGAQEDWHRLMGLFVCLAGALLSLAILITSDRGQKAASMGISYAAALALAGGASFGLHVYDQQGAAAPAVTAQVQPVVPVVPEVPVVNPDPEALLDELEDVEPEEEELPDPEPEEEAQETSSSGSASNSVPRSGRGAFPASGSTSSSSSTRPAPPVEDDWDDWDEDPEPVRRNDPDPVDDWDEDPEPPRQASTSTGSEGVPLQVLDTMLRTNRGVKSCFVDYRKQTGSMPSGRITVSLTVESSGSANSVRIDGGEYAGTSLDSCLSSAIRNISFPPFSGSSKTYRYPFML